MTQELIERLAPYQRVETQGTVEEVGTVRSNSDRLAYFSARPTGTVRTTGFVLCHSYFELSMLQETEVSLARRAAAAGYACIYVQAPGMGDSEGSPRGCTVEDRVDAATAAFEELSRRVPEVVRPCFFGARLGGLVATLAGQRVPESALVLWDPNFDPAIYWKQVRRLARVAAVVGGQRFFEDPQVELDRDREASVLGVEVTPGQLDDMAAAASFVVKGTVQGPVLLVCLDEFSARSAERTLSGVVRGSVETRSIGQRDIWHLGLRRGKGALEPTIEWLKERVV